MTATEAEFGPRVFTLDETAARLTISRDQVEVLIHAGDLVATNVGAGKFRPRLRVSAKELDRFIDARALLARAPGRPRKTA